MVLQKSCKTGVDRDVSERKERQLCAREWYACIYFRDDFSIAVVVKNNENLSVYMESLLLLFLANFPDHHHF